MMRQPLGDNVVHVGGPDLVANAGAVEFGGPAQGPVGTTTMGAGDWASDPIPFPGSPGVDSIQVHPIIYSPEESAIWPRNDPDHWKGEEASDVSLF